MAVFGACPSPADNPTLCPRPRACAGWRLNYEAYPLARNLEYRWGQHRIVYRFRPLAQKVPLWPSERLRRLGKQFAIRLGRPLGSSGTPGPLLRRRPRWRRGIKVSGKGLCSFSGDKVWLSIEDTNGDGSDDTWSYYRSGKLVSVYRDLEGHGQTNVRELYQKGELTQVQSKAASGKGNRICVVSQRGNPAVGHPRRFTAFGAHLRLARRGSVGRFGLYRFGHAVEHHAAVGAPTLRILLFAALIVVSFSGCRTAPAVPRAAESPVNLPTALDKGRSELLAGHLGVAWTTVANQAGDSSGENQVPRIGAGQFRERTSSGRQPGKNTEGHRSSRFSGFDQNWHLDPSDTGFPRAAAFNTGRLAERDRHSSSEPRTEDHQWFVAARHCHRVWFFHFGRRLPADQSSRH